MQWTKEKWDAELALIRTWRKELGSANAHATRCVQDAREVLKKYTEWTDHQAVLVAMAWHPSKWMSEVVGRRRSQSAYSVDPTDGSGIAYRLLENEGGRLSRADRRPDWASGPDARARFMILSAALVLFEEGMYREARSQQELWVALQWMTRFHGNLLRVRDDTLQRRKAGGKNREARQRVAAENRQSVDAAFRRLAPSQRGPGAVAIVCRNTGLSAPTVRGHLAALGHRIRK